MLFRSSVRHYILTPNVIGTTFTAYIEAISANVGSTSYATRGNKFVKHGLLCHTYSGAYFLGSFRQIVGSRAYQNNLILRENLSNIIGFTVSASDTVVNQAIILLT